jgi:hypothetical protein
MFVNKMIPDRGYKYPRKYPLSECCVDVHKNSE